MDGKEFAQAAHRLLQAEMRSRGRGTITEVEEALGMPLRTINRMRNENQLRVADLYNILDQLGIQTSTFFLRLEAEIKAGNLPSAPGGGGGLSGLPRRSSRDEETLARLRDADEMRYNDPVAALRAVSDLRPRVTRATAHLYYAVGGSCFRSLDFFENARACLKLAIEAASSDQELAICHQRLAYTQWLQEPKAALSEARRAQELYSACSDEIGISTTLVDMATFHGTMGQLDAAKECAAAALQYECLPVRHVVGALHAMAHAELEVDQEAGYCSLKKALAAAETLTDRSTTGNLLWFSGRAFRNRSYFEEAIETFGEHFPFNALATGLEKCQLFEDRDAQKETMRSLRAYCRHPLYQLFLDHVYAYVHTGRFAGHTFDYSRVWERWRASQTRRIKIL